MIYWTVHKNHPDYREGYHVAIAERIEADGSVTNGQVLRARHLAALQMALLARGCKRLPSIEGEGSMIEVWI